MSQLLWASSLLHKLKNKTFVPQVYMLGIETYKDKEYNVMIMEMLGYSLQQLFVHSKRFDLKTTCLLAL